MTTMAGGVFFAIVGASGVGKDTLIDGVRAALKDDPRYVFARRVITRPADAGGEAHEAVSEEIFEQRLAAGDFLVSWQAHGLRYGLPAQLASELAAGRHVIANGSRDALPAMIAAIENLVVIEIVAPDAIVAQRLRSRGREDDAAIAARLARKRAPFPEGLRVVRVSNDASAAAGIERLLAVLREPLQHKLRIKRFPIDTWREQIAYLPENCTVVAAAEYLGPGRIDVLGEGRSVRARVHMLSSSDAEQAWLAPDEIGLSHAAFQALGLPEGARVTIQRTPTPESLKALRRKVAGEPLDEPAYGMLVRDIVEGRYPDGEVAAFLVSATQNLTDQEVLALARVRSSFSDRIAWNEPIVADKHSMGGIPGSRITMIVVPIVAAHGLAIPKTSSRAITSAAGTADAMEAVARVDLTVEDVQRVVAEARGCVAWNGRLNHSVVDDVMNAITRPLGIDSNRWSVASILSKKLSAGSTHVIIDLPYGPRAKLKSAEEAGELARLFEMVGEGIGLTVEAYATDGSAPIGRGIGPALEVRDVRWVLNGDERAPADLREKALFFASRILAWDPAIGSLHQARARAEDLLSSGAAAAAFERIVDAQGRKVDPAGPGRATFTVKSGQSGKIAAIDGWVIADIARRAGAPMDKGAGIDLLRRVGDDVMAGEPLYVIHANAEIDLAVAAARAQQAQAYLFED